MSVQKRANGRYRVAWKVNGRQHSKTFDRKADADRYDIEIKRRKALGPQLLAELERSHETLDDFVRGPWRAHAATLAAKTRTNYRWALENHLRELADEALVTIDVPMLAGHQRLLMDRGLRPDTIRKVMGQLAGILQIAVEHGRIPANPVRSLRKVPAAPREEVDPLAPAEVQRLIAAASDHDLVIIALGAHLGLSPIEIRSVTWENWTGDRLTITAAQTKPSRAKTRTITVPKIAAAILREWRLESGGRDGDQIVPMNARQMNYWNVTLRALAGRDDVTAYTLRHSHASLLHYASFTIPEAARRMGHSQIVHLRHYAHALEGLQGKRYADLDAAITAASAPAVAQRLPAER